MNALTVYLAAALVVALAAVGGLAAALFHVNRVSGERWTRVRFLKCQVANHRREEIRLSAECGRLRERITDLRDQQTALVTGEPSLTESVLADLAAIETTEEREYPR